MSSKTRVISQNLQGQTIRRLDDLILGKVSFAI